MSTSGHDRQGRDDGRGPRRREYALGAAGALLVVALLAFLSYQALAVRESSPALALEVVEVERSGPGYAVHVEVRNDGGTTAEAVHVTGSLVRDGDQVGSASASLAYVPPESRRTVALVFSEDPRDGVLTIAPAGYQVS